MGAAYSRHVGPAGGYLVARRFQEEFAEAWFAPEFWGNNAEPVASGGRGSAWFVGSGNEKNLVLRHFCRGGLPGRFIHRDYLFLKPDLVRSFTEFRLLDELFQSGMPVPEPIAAGYWRRGGVFYQAALIVSRIPGASPLAEFTESSHESTWTAAGACVRRFHDARVYHADLNCMNILVADDIYLIDFDRGRFMPADGKDDWEAGNIRRLERSVAKAFRASDAGIQDLLWQAFLKGYTSESAGLGQ